MPEATVDEECQPIPRVSHVRATGQVPTMQPRECISRRTAISGFESLPLIDAIRRLRASRVSLSTTWSPYLKPSSFALRAAWNASTASAKGRSGLKRGRTIINDGLRRW